MDKRTLFASVLAGLLAGAGAAPGEPARLDPEAARIVGAPRSVSPNQMQQGQQNPNQVQGQTPPVQQFPAGQQSIVPPAAATDDPRRPGGADGDRHRRDAIPEAVTVPEIERASLGLDQLNADEARERNGFDANKLGPRNDDSETAALIDQLRGLTGASNQDRQSDQTRSYGSVIERDPGALLSRAGAGRASDNVQHETRTNADGTTTETTKRHDNDGNVVQFDQITRDSNGGIVSAEQSDVGPETTTTHRATRTSEGDYLHTVTTTRRDGSQNTGPTPWRSPDWVASVDPDSEYGKGGGWVPGKGPRAPKVVEARNDGTPGGRPPSPDDHGGVGAPRLDVSVDLVGQPNPDEEAGGSAVGRMIENPNDDIVDPPRPIQ